MKSLGMRRQGPATVQSCVKKERKISLRLLLASCSSSKLQWDAFFLYTSLPLHQQKGKSWPNGYIRKINLIKTQIKWVESKQGTNTEQTPGDIFPTKFLQIFAAPWVSWSFWSHHVAPLRTRTERADAQWNLYSVFWHTGSLLCGTFPLLRTRQARVPHCNWDR